MSKRVTFLVVLLMGLMGCQPAEETNASSGSGAQTKEGIQKQIEAVQNNPNMPPQAKEAAINALKGTMAQAESAGKKEGETAKARSETQK